MVTIDLDDGDLALVQEIEFDPLKVGPGEPTWENCEKAAVLMGRLLQRKVIPKIRGRVFYDDEYATSRKTSPWRYFQRNGNDFAETIRHPHFLKWLRYFIYGPELPSGFITEFEEFVTDLGIVTSGDLDPLMRRTRQLVRKYGLQHADADEVFKLALEVGLSVHWARNTREATMRVARRQ